MSVPSDLSQNSDDRDSEKDTNQGQAKDIVEKKAQRSSVVWRYFGYLKSDKQE